MAEEKFYDKFKPKKKTQKKNNKQKNDLYSGKKDSKSAYTKFENKNGKSRFQNDGSKKTIKTSTAKSYNFTKLNSLFKYAALDETSANVLENFDQVIQSVRPLNSKQLQQLPDNIRTLSHQLTDERSTRRLGYMNENIQLSSYVRYYTWWNLVRLTRLFANLPAEAFPATDSICLDLGSGPLTVVIALWLARPELRNLKLTWYCLDVSQNSLSLGEDIYLSIAAKYADVEHWNIIRIKGSFGTELKQKADFITCANMFNELDQSNDNPPEQKTKQYFDQLKRYSTENAKFCLIEPGVPKSARTLSLLRERFINNGKTVLSPCPHNTNCPMNGFKAYTGSQNKWCNFAFSTEQAPKKLQKLSDSAKLPKDRAVLSFITAIPSIESKTSNLKLRIASDSFTLPGHYFGIYACSSLGLTLIRTTDDLFKSGDYIEVTDFSEQESVSLNLPVDEKSGAKILDLKTSEMNVK